jgi:two-component system response regulator AtoC
MGMAEPLPKRILVVDDEAPVRAICARMLTPLGYVVETIENADRAIVRFKEQPFDLVITDYSMPGELNGLTFGRAVREHSPHTRIILMTAFPAVDTAVATLRMGAFDYLVKPFDQKELIQRVQACFAQQPLP